MLLAGANGNELASMRAHLEECEVCQEVVALASSASADVDVPIIRDGDTILERYRVLGELGRGAMGVVYRVHDPKLGRDLAVKVLHSADPSASLRLEREAKALARLSHPNIVTVFDIGSLGDQLCMVMELVDGSSLREWLDKRRDRYETLRVFRQAAEGLCAAHRAGFVHRDFKPENVLIGGNGLTKIVDFGLAASDVVSVPLDPPGKCEVALDAHRGARLPHASAIHRLTRTGAIVGTPAYMAPEQFRGIEADARSDQFAFAVCLWEALSGEHPFHAATLDELKRNLDRGPTAASDVHRRDGLTKTLRRALSPAPEDRFASMDDLVRHLGVNVLAKRSRAGLRALGILATGIVAAGALFFIPKSKSRDDRSVRSAATFAPRQDAPVNDENSSPAPRERGTPNPNASIERMDVRSQPAPPAGSMRFRHVSTAPKPLGSSVGASNLAPTSAPARGPNGAPLID